MLFLIIMVLFFKDNFVTRFQIEFIVLQLIWHHDMNLNTQTETPSFTVFDH